MPIETICASCAKKLRVADEHAGKQARCPNCGHVYTVPQLTPSSYSPLATDTTAQVITPAFQPPAKPGADQWYLKIDDGRQFGPIDRATLDQWFRERRIGPSSQVRNTAQAPWQPAASVYPTLTAGPVATTGGTGPNSPNPFADQPQHPNQNPYSSSNYVGGGNRNFEPHRGGLVLTLGILGLCCCFILGIVAWVMAAEDLKKMRDGRMDPSGQGMTTAGMVIGIVSIVLQVLSFVGSAFLGAIN
jgi:hypothetical protein